MSVHPNDLNEIRRLVTNSHGDERAFLIRVINGIVNSEKEFRLLQGEVKKMKAKTEAEAKAKADEANQPSE